MDTFTNTPKSADNGSILLESGGNNFLLQENGFELILDQLAPIYTNQQKN